MQFGPFCQLCARHYKCSSCTKNSYDPRKSPEDHLCAACLAKPSIPQPQTPLCICPGCAGNPSGRPKVPAHAGTCATAQQKGMQFGPFCKSCAIHHKCSSCTKNSYDPTKSPDERLCAACLTKASIPQKLMCVCCGCSGPSLLYCILF